MSFNKEPVWIGKTKGEVIEYNNVLIGLPKVVGKLSIIGCNRKKSTQKWFIQQPPDSLVPNTEDEHEDFLSREFDRIANGVWFMNNGTPTYITGLHYYYLNYIKIDIGSPEYRDRDRLFFYFMEASLRHENSLGVTLVKPRRFGASWMGVAWLLCPTTTTKNAISAVMSKTGEDARDFFVDKLVFAFKRLPFWLQPTTSSGSNPKTSLDFEEHGERTKKNSQNLKRVKGLNSRIKWKNTTENAFDGQKLLRWFFDEIGKLKKDVRLSTTVQVHAKTLQTGRRIVGQGFLPSTVNDLDKGGKQYEDFFNSSLLIEDGNEETGSGFWGLFIPAYDGLEGFIDEYGMSVIEDPEKPIMGSEGVLIKEGSMSYLNRKRKLLEDNPSMLVEFKRQMPFTIKEAFYQSAKDCHFDAGIIREQMDYNESLTSEPYIEGEFMWEGMPFDSDVYFLPKKGGNFKVSWLPPKELSNNRYYKGDKVYPGNISFGVGGVDSYDLDKTVDGRGSEGGFHLYNKLSMNDDAPSNAFVLEYIHRPNSAYKYYEDVLKAAQYYGYDILVENNKYGIVRFAEERGYGEYFMDRPKHTYSKTQMSRGSNSKTKGVPSNSEDIINLHAEGIMVYVLKHLGEREDGSMGYMPFNRTLSDWLSFDINNRTSFDATISSGLCLMALNRKVKERKKVERQPFVSRGKVF